MIDFLAGMPEWQFYACLFTLFTCLAFLSRGKAALQWSRGMATSGVTNFLYFKIIALIGGVFFIGLIPLQNWYQSAGMPMISRDFWNTVPFPLMCLALLLVYDFSMYWIHRALHAPWLWPMHAVHHSDTDMNFLTWSRGHPMEQAFMAMCLVLSSTWIGLEIKEIAGLFMLTALHQYYVHSNIDWDHGPLSMVIVSPQFHRWHHVDHPDAYDKNFATIFPFLDKMFGTYHNPGSAAEMPTGFEGTPGHNIIKLITYPFTEWIRMIGAFLPRQKKLTDAPSTSE